MEILYCPDKKRYHEAVDNSLAASKLITGWFVTSKIIIELFTALYAKKNVLYFNEDACNAVFSCSEMSILNIDVNNRNLGNNFDEDDLDTSQTFSLA